MNASYIRNKLVKYLTKEDRIEFKSRIPEYSELENEFSNLDNLGLYVHIPFCNSICPYCPYNKEIYSDEKATKYVQAIKKEMDIYASMIGSIPITSFYIGGGTPTSLIGNGLEEIIEHVYRRFNMHCGIHIESYPNHLTNANLATLKSLGVKYLSLGVEALQDHHLKVLKRRYTAKEGLKSVERALTYDFECVNMDFMFDLPGQTKEEISEAVSAMIDTGVHQVATYPLFNFEYSHLNSAYEKKRGAVQTMFRRRNLLKILEDQFYDNEYYRSSVWAFTKKGIDKYCSVTVPVYLGLGASGSSYLNNIFYVNTFKVHDYVASIENGKLPVSLSIDLTFEMQMMGWLYWRIYETRFYKSDFNKRFHLDFDQKYGRYMKSLQLMGYLHDHGDRIELTDRGTYWIHAFEDFFSISYINSLWGKLRKEAWPESVVV